MVNSPSFTTAARLGAVASAAAIAVACATNPTTGKREFTLMSEAQGIQMGQQSDPEIRKEMGVVNDPRLQQYVDGIGQRLASGTERPGLPWTFTVVDSPSVNAFALPWRVHLPHAWHPRPSQQRGRAGGRPRTRDCARDGAPFSRAIQQADRRLARTAARPIFVPELRPFGQAAEAGLGVLFLKFGRDDELQADNLGAGYATAEGWDSRGVASMLETLGRLAEGTDCKGVPNWLSTHPMPADCVDRLEERVAALRAQAPRDLAVNRVPYLERVDGLMFGENPREGVIRGNAFLHPDLRFRLEFPAGWRVQNSPQQVVAQAPGRRIRLPATGAAARAHAPGGGRNDLGESACSSSTARTRASTGCPPSSARFRGRCSRWATWCCTRRGSATTPRCSASRGSHPRAPIARSSGSWTRACARSSRSAPWRPSASGPPCSISTVQQGDTWDSIATGPGRSLVPPATLAVINGFAVQERPQAGDRLKIVVDGR